MSEPRPCDYEYVDNEQSLERLVGKIDQAQSVAIDTEADSLHHFYEKVCLIQFSVNGSHFIIDPLVRLDLGQLMSVMSEKLLILHYADYDLRMLRRGFSFAPGGGVFDTMAAAELLGYTTISLQGLVERHFGILLPKGSKKSDWSKRPLSEKQLSYAINDTCYLHELMDKLRLELRQLGREDWHKETCACRVEAAMSDRPPANDDNCWRIRGLRGMSDRQLAVVRDVWHWRLKEAQQADLPPFKVGSNGLLMALAYWASENDDLDWSKRRSPKLPRSCIGSRLSRLKKALRHALDLPGDRLPTHRPRSSPTPPAKGFDALRAECAKIAEKLNLSPSLIASRSTISRIAHAKPKNAQQIVEKVPGVMNWQAELIEKVIAKAWG